MHAHEQMHKEAIATLDSTAWELSTLIFETESFVETWNSPIRVG